MFKHRATKIFWILFSLIILAVLAYDLSIHFYYQSRITSLLDSSREAFHAKNMQKAESDALDLLNTCATYNRMNLHANFSTYGDAIHYGNIILGIIALTRDDLPSASRYLILAGNTPGSPELNKFGPCMMLAEALLQRGKREVVIEYLKLSSGFWKDDESQLKRWIHDVHEGGIPDFGKRLCV